MPFKPFTTPHCHPQSLDSGSTPENMVKREIELGTGTVTVTDHGSLAAARKIYDLAKSKGLDPILGLEGYFRDDNCPILKAKGVDPAKHLKYYHITLHALDQEGYYTLVRKLSEAPIESHGSESKPIFNWADLEEIGAKNVTVGSGCLVGMVQRHLLAYGDKETAKAYYSKLRSIFKPGNFIVEVFPHRCTHDWVEGVFVDFEDGTSLKWSTEKNVKLKHLPNTISARAFAAAWQKDKSVVVEHYLHYRKPVEVGKKAKMVRLVEDFVENECLPWTTNPNVQQACNEVVIEFAEEFGDPVVISDDSHYAHPEDKVVQDIRLGQMGNWRFYGTYARMSSDDVWAYFKENGVPQLTFEKWIDNNQEWAARFKGFTLNEPVSLPKSFYPQDTLLHTMGLIRKTGRMQWKNREYVERLRAEINLLHYNGTIDLLPYFFIDQDVCAAYADRGLLTGPGRGSAAGLLLTYLLGITHVDPLKFGLSMDRFLTVDRIKSGKLPDIDQDLPDRDLLVEKHKEDRLELTLEDGSTRLMEPWAMVDTDKGPMRIDAALAAGLVFEVD